MGKFVYIITNERIYNIAQICPHYEDICYLIGEINGTVGYQPKLHYKDIRDLIGLNILGHIQEECIYMHFSVFVHL